MLDKTKPQMFHYMYHATEFGVYLEYDKSFLVVRGTGMFDQRAPQTGVLKGSSGQGIHPAVAGRRGASREGPG